MNKKILIVLVIAILALSAVFAVSCKRTTGPQVKPVAEPVLDSVSLARKNSAYTDPENTLCLELVQGKCETVVVTLNFTNTANLAIYSIKINTVEYGKADFKSGATPQKVQIEVSPLFNTPGNYTIDVESVNYSTGVNVKAIDNFTTVSQAVRVAPTFTMTLDMTASLLSGEEEIETHENVPFMGYLDYLYDSSLMDATDTAPEGYAFAGWYASAAPDIDKDKSYDAGDEYDFYKDMTFYAVYMPVYNYTVTSGSATITGLTKFGRSQSILRLPETMDGYTIREIGADAFSGTFVTNVYFNASLRKIGARAFKDCTSLRAVSFNDNLTEISAQAFSGCTKLNGLALFPESLTTLGTKAFEYCGWNTLINTRTHTKTLFIPETLREIGSYCFQYSTFINVYFINRESENPEPVTYGEGMFYSSSSLEKVQTATALTAAGEVAAISGTVSGAPRIPAKAFEYCTSLKTVTLAEGLQSIGSEAFMCVSGTMTNFTSITLPNSIKSVGSYAFGNVPLATLAFASDTGSLLESIGDYAFQGSKLLGSITLKTPELVSYGASPFYNSLGITAIFLNTQYVPSFKTANTNAVQTLNNRMKYFVPLSLLNGYKNEWVVEFSIGGYVSNTVKLNIYAQEYITQDGKVAYDIQSIDGVQSAVITNFFDSAGATVTVPDTITVGTTLYTVKKIGPYVASADVTRINFTKPEYIVYIDDCAFYYSTKLRAFCAEEGSNVSRFERLINLDTIGKYAFEGTAIDNFKAPDSLRKIDEYAFAHTPSLTKVFITGDEGENNGISLGVSAFQYCGADTVVLGSRVTAIHQLAFSDCSSLVYFVMEHEDPPARGKDPIFGILGASPPAACRMYLRENFYNYLVSNNIIFYKDYNKVIGGWNHTTNTVYTL